MITVEHLNDLLDNLVGKPFLFGWTEQLNKKSAGICLIIFGDWEAILVTEAGSGLCSPYLVSQS
jgi:hypothetical protein